MESRRRLTAPSLPAVALALTVLVGGLAAAGAVRSTDRRQAEHESEAAAGQLGLSFHAALDDVSDTVDAAARSTSPFTIAATALAAGIVHEVAVTDSQLQPDDPSVGFALILGDPALAAVAGASRDHGRATASAPYDLPDGGHAVLVLAPIYRSGATLVSVADRHANLEGYVAAEARLQDTVRRAASSAGIDGSVVAAPDPGGAPPGSVTFTALGLNWRASVEPSDGFSAVPASIAIGAIGAALVIAAVSSGMRRARADARLESERRAEQIALANDVGAILHSSLDLGDVLPGVAVRLSDEFDLVGFAVSVASPDGTLDDVFSMGARLSGTPTHVRELPSRADVLASETGDPTSLVLPLEQAGRAVGALWLCGREPFGAEHRARLLPVADLAGSALGNARAHAQESDARRHLADLDQMRTEFLATASHELRTPATTIEGFAQLLDAGWDELPEEQRHDLVHRIARNARSLSQLLEQLLAFTRMERRSLVVEVGTHDIDEIVRRVIDLSTPLLEHHEIILRTDGPALATVDPFATERVLLNLLTNASKYSPPGTDIEVDVERAGERVLLRVTDHGPGIPLEERHLIFERFYRGGSQTAVKTRGAGIGLAVVKELIDRLGATVEVGQTPGGGARFTVAFAAAATDAAADAADGQRQGATNGAA